MISKYNTIKHLFLKDLYKVLQHWLNKSKVIHQERDTRLF